MANNNNNGTAANTQNDLVMQLTDGYTDTQDMIAILRKGVNDYISTFIGIHTYEEQQHSGDILFKATFGDFETFMYSINKIISGLEQHKNVNSVT